MQRVTIPLDQERELQFSVNAVVELEERFDVPIPELFKEGRIGIGLIRAVLYIGLKHGGMKFNGRTLMDEEKAVGDLIQEHWIEKGRTLNELVEKITDAFTGAGIFSETQEAATNPSKGAGSSK